MEDFASYLKELPGERIRFADRPWPALCEFLAEEPVGPVAVFTGKHSLDASGRWRELEEALAASGRPVRRFREIDSEPDSVTVEAMLAFLRQERPGAVVAVGGGSVMDAAKAAFLVFQTGCPLAEHYGVDVWSGRHPGEELRRVIAVPTTSGTGSEATPYANIVERSLGVKKLISERQTIPRFAVVSPELAGSMPPSVTRATGCDALAHLIEGFLNVGADRNCPDANRWALTGIRLVREHLEEAVSAGSAAARRAMAQAAVLGGMVIRFKSTGLPHLCSFSWFGRLEHGLAVALLLPECWRYYLGNPAVAERTMELSGIFPGTTPDTVIDSFRRFLDRVGVARSLGDYPGITPELLAATAAGAAENRMKLELAPRPVPVERAEAILSEILRRASETPPRV